MAGNCSKWKPSNYWLRKTRMHEKIRKGSAVGSTVWTIGMEMVRIAIFGTVQRL